MNSTTWMVLIGLIGSGFVLHTIGKALVRALEWAAVIAAVFGAIWFAARGIYQVAHWLVVHWRTTLTTLVVTACWVRFGWRPLAIGTSWTVEALGVWWLIAWQLGELTFFDHWIGRHLRGWWLRWTLYARRMPKWFRNCRLSITDTGQGVTVFVNPFRRTGVAPKTKPRRDQLPRIIGVRSGASWDEVRVRLVAGQKPEDFDLVARELAVARGVTRCQIRELDPDVVSVDFQRRNLLAQIVHAPELADLVNVAGKEVDLRQVWSGRTEYGHDWHQPLLGGHTLTAGATGAGKGSVMWCPLVAIAPAIRDGLVRVSGIDPKGMELAYGRRIFHRYAVTAKDALAVLDEVTEEMERRKEVYAGKVRTVDITADCPLELVEFDEIGALTRYISDRKVRDQINDRLSVLTTQGRALGITIRGYVQEPTKDTVPVRDLFPRRICLRVATKSHVGMVLGEHAYDRGAWANRIGESEAGVGYLFGEGIREPLRIRAGWVSDDQIKALETFVATAEPAMATGQLLELPARVQRSTGGVA
ncbi:MAG TPA: FtsK/SpoIIIE domain-containing protein [Pseudonocardia sp.]|nr:FtsK/SpoIIIE domain-containing protein [Pseudonocardia sp.]